MSYMLLKFSTYYAVVIIVLTVFNIKLFDSTFYLYAAAPLAILFYFNIYLYFKEACKSNDRHVPNNVSRLLARTSGVYFGTVGICMVATALQDIDEYHFGSIELFITLGLFYFLGGYVGFYFFEFFIRFSLSNTISKKLTKW